MAEWSDGINLWEELKNSGLFNYDYNSASFTPSLFSIKRNEALFVLSDSTIYSTYLPEDREDLASIPFPGSIEQNWVVGSGFYFGTLLADDKNKSSAKMAELFQNFLFSSSVREDFLIDGQID
ncbi:MAG: hypothetical protein JEY99_16940 [Spirochaetales bacterium]|nr:hypothetical protein [Spirochaetales bacterium]